MIRLREISLPFDHDEQSLVNIILEYIGISKSQLLRYTIVRKSINARRKNNILAVYTIDAELKNEPELLSRFSNNILISAGPCINYQLPAVSNIHNHTPVVVGKRECKRTVSEGNSRQ